MTVFSCIECIGGKDVSRVKPVFSDNSEVIFVANGNKVDIHNSHNGDFITSLNSEVSTSQQIVALFLNPINTKHLVAVFQNGCIVTWVADNGSIDSSNKLQCSGTILNFDNVRCHVDVIDTSEVDIYAIVTIKDEKTKTDVKKLKVFSYRTGKERILHHNTLNSLLFKDVGSLNVIQFGGPDSIQSNGKTISGRYLCAVTGPKIYVIFLRCIFEPRYELEMAIHNRQEIRMKSCWYQMGGGRTYTSVTCHPTEYNVAVGDSTGRVVVYTGVFLHAQDTRHVHDSVSDRKRHLSEDKLTEELSDSEDEQTSDDKEKSKKSDQKTSESVAKRWKVTRHMTWAVTTVYHWHSFPVLDVLYSETGNFIYSGGGERVLAEWTLPHSRRPRTLPRLPGSIVNITSNPNGQMIVSTRDNSLHLVDHTSFTLHKVITSIQRLVRDEYRLHARVDTSILSHDPRTSSLLLNSRKGHVQFFSLQSNCLLFNLDITEENIVSELHHESSASPRDKQGSTVLHSDVVNVSVTYDGLCLASVETLEENHVLKFWNYCAEAKIFKLTSVISKPHKAQPINHLRFSPSRAEFNDPHTYTCVSTGGDEQYIVWSCTHKDKAISWSRDKEDNYHGLKAGPVGFSQDGSSLAVGFGPCLTLWDRNFDLKCSLSHVCDKADKHNIRFLEWGQGAECSHLLVGACSSFVRVWNTVLGHNVWQVPIAASLLVADPASSYMALFTSTDKIYIFKPSSMKPESVISTKDQGRPVSACFVSHGGVDEVKNSGDTAASWHEITQLFFLNDQLELMFVKQLNPYEDKSSALPIPFKPVQVKTPFSSMIPEEVIEPRVEESEREEDKYENYRNLGAIDQFLSFNPIAMAPLELVGTQLIKSTLNKKRKALNKEKLQFEEEGETITNDLLDVHDFDDFMLNEVSTALCTMDDSCVTWIKNLV